MQRCKGRQRFGTERESNELGNSSGGCPSHGVRPRETSGRDGATLGAEEGDERAQEAGDEGIPLMSGRAGGDGMPNSGQSGDIDIGINVEELSGSILAEELKIGCWANEGMMEVGEIFVPTPTISLCTLGGIETRC